jgi:hypothetical protein
MHQEFDRVLEFVRSTFPIGFRKIERARTIPRVRFEAISVGSALALRQNPTLEVEPAEIERKLEDKGVILKAIQQPIDTGTAAGKCFLDMLGVFAEFETSLRKERQMEGIAKAKARGVYKGRKPTIDVEEVKQLKAGGMGATAIAKELRIGRASVYRVLSEAA